MGESTIKGFEWDESTNRRKCSRICVEGYDTWLHEYDLELALTKHFSSCGEIIHVHVPRDYQKGILKSPAFIHIIGEDALEKALQLSGSDLGGWRVFAKAISYDEKEVTDSGLGFKNLNSIRKMQVTGFDTWLPKIDLQIGLTKHFSSCGEVTDVMILGDERLRSIAFVSIMGQSAVDKALELSGCDVGGWNITVTRVLPPPDAKHYRLRMSCPSRKAPSRVTRKQQASRKVPLSLVDLP